MRLARAPTAYRNSHADPRQHTTLIHNRRCLMTPFMTRFLPATVGMLILGACVESQEERLIGGWVRNDRSGWAIVRRTGEAWIVEDGDGTYPTVYDHGVLRITAGFLAEGVAIYDDETDALLIRGLSREYEFGRARCSPPLTGVISDGDDDFDFRPDCTFRGRVRTDTYRGVYETTDSSATLYAATFSGGKRGFDVRGGKIDFEAEWSVARNAYIAAMKSDLRNLVTAEEYYFSRNMTYATRRQLVSYRTSAGITVTISNVSRRGWQAAATHAGVDDKTCVIYIGKNTPPGAEEGEPQCD